jgi:hypothetical protein
MLVNTSFKESDSSENAWTLILSRTVAEPNKGTSSDTNLSVRSLTNTSFFNLYNQIICNNSSFKLRHEHSAYTQNLYWSSSKVLVR